jgi:hypothetical protein
VTEPANPQGPLPRFDARRAVANAYLSLAFGLPSFARLLLFWSVAGAAVVWIVPEAVALGISLETGAEMSPTRDLIRSIAHAGMVGVASVFVGIVTFRWIILREPVRRVFPLDVASSAEYGFRLLRVVVATSLVAILAWRGLVASGPVDDVAATIIVDFVNSACLAALTGPCLALASSAVASGRLTFLGAWRRTAGSWWPLFYGALACELPFLAAFEAVNAQTAATDPDTALAALLDLALAWLELLNEITWCAFIAYAYLHFMRDDPHHQSPAFHFT